MAHRLRRGLTATAAALSLGCGLSIAGPAGFAHAAASDCDGGRNGFTDISDSLTGRVVPGYPFEIGGSHFSLEYGTVGGVQRGWAHLAASGISFPQDEVWMDWTRDGGASWIQCGPFTLGSKSSKTTAAQHTSNDHNWRFRACGKVYPSGYSYCGPWW
ncbi:hypothetical protein [Streptomyces sp. NPDC005485]|uniref:hypothetical protein n=1 Tax=Streptomyces sp. NPDC005485 TaxID=3155591 RepID=UPI0033BCBE46